RPSSRETVMHHKEMRLDRPALLVGCAVLALTFTWTGRARPMNDSKDIDEAKEPDAKTFLSPEEERKQLIAADKFARGVAGDAKPPYHRLLAAAGDRVRQGKAKAAGAAAVAHTAEHRGIVSPFAQVRAKVRSEAAERSSILHDPAWQKNFEKLFAQAV